MTRPLAGRSSLHRARRAFLGLVGIAVVAMGSLSSALASEPGPMTGVRVALSGIALIAALALAARVVVAIERARRHADRDAKP